MGTCDADTALIEKNLLYCTTNRIRDDLLNVTIVAGIELGRTYRHLFRLLVPQVFDEQDLQWHKEFVLTSLIQAAFAQANTGKQRQLALSWNDYMEIACLKSNMIFDLINCVRDILDHDRFLQTRFNAARYCEQLIDDLLDYDEDTRRGVLGWLHVRVIEQGRLAEKMLPYLEQYGANSERLTTILKSMLLESRMLQTHYAGILCFYNPFIQAKRHEYGDILVTVDTNEAVLREIFVNAPSDMTLSLEKLLRRRVDSYKAFCHHWSNGEYGRCARIVDESSIAHTATRGFIKFLRQTKDQALTSHYKHGNALIGKFYYYGSISLFGMVQKL